MGSFLPIIHLGRNDLALAAFYLAKSREQPRAGLTKERDAMRYQSMIFPVLAISLLAVACNDDDNPEIPRTVPPTLKSTITTIDAPAIAPKLIKPSKPPVVRGSGPIYET